MALSYVGRVGSASGNTSVSSFSATLSTAIAAGNLIIISVTGTNLGDTNDLASISDTSGNSYVTGVHTTDPGQNTLAAVWYCDNCLALSSGDTITVNLSSALLTFGESWVMTVDVVGDAATSSVTDGSNSHNSQCISASTTWDTNSITTTNANDFLWVLAGTNQGESAAVVQADCTPSSGWTIPTAITVGSNGHHSAYQIVSATGTYTGGGTAQAFCNGVSAVIIAFKAGSGGPTPITQTDSATGQEDQTLDTLPSDTSAGAEAQSVNATFAASDSASGAETQTLDPVPTETATGAEAQSLNATLAPTDTSAGAEATAIAFSASDTSTGSDSISVSNATLAPSDASTGAEANTIELPTTDTGAGSESAIVANTISQADTSAGAEAQAIGAPLSDTSAGADSAAVAASISTTETATGAEAQAIGVLPLESGTGSDSAPVGLVPSDTATGAEAASLQAALPVADTGNANDSIVVNALGGQHKPPPPMPLISLNVPAFTRPNAYTPSRANDDLYGTTWRSVDVPSVGTPVYLCYDLSGVPSGQRSTILVNLINEQGNLYLKADASDAASLFTDYLLEGNNAAGGSGSMPNTGWVTLASVTGNLYPTRQHILPFTGYNWLRLTVTASSGASPNNDLNVQMDVHNASAGNVDSWLFLGDSITLEGQVHPLLGGGGEWGYGGPICKIIRDATNQTYYPATIDGGNGGMTMAWAATNIAALLANFSGGFIVLAFGTNDANQNFQYASNGSQVTTYYNNLLACVDAALATGATVIVPYVPYGSNNGGDLGFNANLFNQYVDTHLPTDRPTVLRGPDFWTFFNNNPGLLRSDGIHPSFVEVGGAASGYEQMHMLWANWMLANVYLWQNETAVGAENVAIGVPTTNAAAGSETVGVAFSLAPSDTATGAEAQTIGAPTTETATGAEAQAIGAQLPTETATGAASAIITPAISELGTGDEAGSMTGPQLADSGVGSEQISGINPITDISVNDTATGAESIATQTQALGAGDAAIGAEAPAIGVTASDTGTGVAATSTGPSLTDPGTGAETISVGAVTLDITDTGRGVDSPLVTASTAETDTAHEASTAQPQQGVARGYGLLLGPSISATTSDQNVISSTSRA